MSSKVYVQGKPIQFDQSQYKGAGGEGTIYAHNGRAYKIYHDPARCIPEGKINELATIKLPNVLGPEEVITDRNNQPIGFIMPFVENTEYLCKLFTKGFCSTNNITPQDCVGLAKRMQDTLDTIHQRKILVVDYNEMNFLTNRDFTEVFHIDVDCYQTPHYPATAIMASIQDPKATNQKWTEESDWFSFAVLICQLYIKTHPYKGRHPDHGKNWQAMMAAGISIFNKATKMPPATLDLAVIPKGHRKWLENVLEHGERSKPPQPDTDNTPAAVPKATIIATTESVEVKSIFRLESKLIQVSVINGKRYSLTSTGIFCEEKKIKSITPETGYQARRAIKMLCPIEGKNDSPALLTFNPLTNTLKIQAIFGLLNEECETQGCFVLNKKAYTTSPAGLIAISLLNLGAKPLAAKEIVANIFHQHQVFDGLVIQDILDKCTITIPTQTGPAQSHRIPQLDRHRILSAKQEGGFAIFLSESKGKLWTTTLIFNKTITAFQFSQEETDHQEEINFTVLDRGICIHATRSQIHIFADLNKKKIIENSPVEPDQKLLSWQNQVFLINQKELLKITLK